MCVKKHESCSSTIQLRMSWLIYYISGQGVAFDLGVNIACRWVWMGVAVGVQEVMFT